MRTRQCIVGRRCTVVVGVNIAIVGTADANTANGENGVAHQEESFEHVAALIVAEQSGGVGVCLLVKAKHGVDAAPIGADALVRFEQLESGLVARVVQRGTKVKVAMTRE